MIMTHINFFGKTIQSFEASFDFFWVTRQHLSHVFRESRHVFRESRRYRQTQGVIHVMSYDLHSFLFDVTCPNMNSFAHTHNTQHTNTFSINQFAHSQRQIHFNSHLQIHIHKHTCIHQHVYLHTHIQTSNSITYEAVGSSLGLSKLYSAEYSFASSEVIVNLSQKVRTYMQQLANIWCIVLQARA